MLRRLLLYILLSLCLGSGVWGDMFDNLHVVFEREGSKPEQWVKVYEATHKSVSEYILGNPMCQLSRSDLLAILKFLKNRNFLLDFFEMDVFKDAEEQYQVWLKNLFCLAYRVSIQDGSLDSLQVEGYRIGDLLYGQEFCGLIKEMVSSLSMKISEQ